MRRRVYRHAVCAAMAIVGLGLRGAAAGDPGVPPARWESAALAIDDLIATFGDRYPQGPSWRARLEGLRASDQATRARAASPERDGELARIASQFNALRNEALLANPLLRDLDALLFIERKPDRLGLPANWQSNSSLPKHGYDNRLRALAPVQPGGQVTTVFEPPGGAFVGDLDLHWRADRLLFSMPGANGGWQVHEIGVDGQGLRELPLIREPDVDNYDACYLPDGRIVFNSTATFVGVPCVFGDSHVTNLYRLETDGSIRQLTVDQEHDWCPTVLPGGRVLYLRWEYTDLPHSNSRRLFHMNPDGTGQAEYLSSSSYFPNSFFYARPLPGHASKVVGVATGHHGNARAGRLLIMDPAQGRREAEPVVQEIPGRGRQVEPLIRDELADGVWPQFLHPYPLSEKYLLTAMKPGPEAPWGIYLVDVFDNLVPLLESPGYALLEPVPVQKRPLPPALPDRTDPAATDATVFLSDIYQGPGLKGVPRGTVRALRLVSYEFGYRGMGGLYGSIGMDGPWDVRRVLGTVPVEPDGSAWFRMPAHTPVAVQPLDEEGKALQLMRSWFTAMPGEVVSCVGCHEPQNSAAANRQALALGRRPSRIAPWYGPARGFNFEREVQPVLDRHCVSCHDGQPRDGQALADLRGGTRITDWSTKLSGNAGAAGGKFSVAYAELHRYVRRPGIEDDIHVLSPLEYHADTTELVQLLRKGHHGVALDPESWDRLITWIDLNAPFHGTWHEIVGEDAVRTVAARAREMRRRYTGKDEDPEAIVATLTQIPREPAAAAAPSVPGPAETPAPTVDGWPFDAAEAARRQEAPETSRRSLDLGGGVTLELVRVPAGAFVMGAREGSADERPATAVSISRPFWIGRCEVTNAQFARFDPGHDSHVEPMHGYQFGIHGYPVSEPQQPVVRVSWEQARRFCEWLSQRTGRRLDLPTEAQWEYACRAGTATPFSFGGLDADYSTSANLGDRRLKEFALETYIQVHLIDQPGKYDDWIPRDDRHDDGGFVSRPVGSYQPNAWGLHDMHGNVREWTRSLLRPLPYDDADSRNDPAAAGLRVVRGGSWYDRPFRATSSYRLGYRPYQGVYDVGFRIVCEDE